MVNKAVYIKRSTTGICFGACSLHYVYINNIDDQINSRLLKFADDTIIYFKVNSPENIERLREDLCKLVPWSKEWQMLFNVEKCKVICTLVMIILMLVILWMVIDYK